MANQSYYDVLHLTPEASEAEVREAYRTLAWNRSAMDSEALRQLDEAYGTLSNADRRAAYDQTLAHAAPEQAPEPAEPALGQRYEAPQGAWLWRLLGWSAQIGWSLSGLRVNLIPVNVGLGIAAVIGLAATVGAFPTALRNQTVQVTTISALVQRGMPQKSYVSVVGQPLMVGVYRATTDGQRTGRYHWVNAGRSVVMVQREVDPASGALTGVLKPMPAGLLKLAVRDSGTLTAKGYQVWTDGYLDADDRPFPIWVLYAAVVAELFGVVIFVIPTLWGFRTFRRSVPTVEPVEELALPASVTLIGRVKPAQGKGWRQRVVGAPALLVKGDDTGNALRVNVYIIKRRQIEPDLFTAPLAAGSRVECGWEYLGGKPKPAVLVRSAQGTFSIITETPEMARAVAASLA